MSTAGDAPVEAGAEGAPSEASRVPMARRAAIAPIRAYKVAVSPLLGERCKYYPSCSDYTVQAIERYGVWRGVVLGAWRLVRCNPWSHGGVDKPESQRLFRR